MTDPTALGRHDSWAGVRAVVAGFGPDGFAAADNLLHLGATVTALDESPGDDERQQKAELLEVLGATVRLGPGEAAVLLDDVDLLIATTDAPLVDRARDRGIPVWGEVELAWRLRDPGHDTPWLAVTGSHGTEQVLGMLDAILRTAGLRSAVVGPGGLPVVEVVMDPEPYDVLAVGLSAAQLAGTTSMSAQAAVVLDVEAGERFGRVYEHVQRACVYNAADPATEDLVREADVVEGARAIGLTVGTPGVGMLGLVEEILADRAFIEERATSAAELATLADLPDTEPRTVLYALAAAALARAHGVSQQAVRDGLRSLR